MQKQLLHDTGPHRKGNGQSSSTSFVRHSNVTARASSDCRITVLRYLSKDIRHFLYRLKYSPMRIIFSLEQTVFPTYFDSTKVVLYNPLLSIY